MYDRIVRIKRSRLYIVETLVAIAILAAINLIFLPDRPAYEGISPNPLWIVVLAMAGRYGRMGALFASALVTVFFFADYLALRGIDAFYDDPWILRFPFLFILVGFMLGEIKTVFILREDYLTNRVEELVSSNEKMTKEMAVVKEAHKGLTIDVASTTDTITILNEITSRLKSIDAKEILKGMLESFRDYLDVEECSFYEQEGNLLTLRESIGWKDYYRRPESYELGQGLIGLTAERRRTMSIKDAVLKKRHDQEKAVGMLGDSVITIPLIGMNEMLYGVASIEKIPLLKLTDSTIQTMRVIAGLAASALNTAYSFKMLEQKQIKEKDFDIFRYHYFLSRLDEEFNRSWNYMLPLSLMAFRWEKIEVLDEEQFKRMMNTIIALVTSHVRTFDVLAKGPTKDTPLVLLLATTSGPQANDLKEKFIARINEYGFADALTSSKLEDSIAIGNFNPNSIKSSQEMLKLIGL
jgi:hypothetical protein